MGTFVNTTVSHAVIACVCVSVVSSAIVVSASDPIVTKTVPAETPTAGSKTTIRGAIGYQGTTKRQRKSTRRIARNVSAGTVVVSTVLKKPTASTVMTVKQNGLVLAKKNAHSKKNATIVVRADVSAGRLVTVLSSKTRKTRYITTTTNYPTALVPPAPTPPTPTPTPTPTPNPSQPTLPPLTGTSVLEYGAVGDGVTDDSSALQRAFDATSSGETLIIPEGKTFVHSKVLTLRNAGQTVGGGGTLYASNEARSSVFVNADNVSVLNLTLKMGTTTGRWDSYEQMKLRVGGVANTILTDVRVEGSAAAGLYVGGAHDFVFTRITVENTRADGIHFTSDTRDGSLTDATVRNPGDDGIAVVSYATSSQPVRNITITNPKLFGQTWGRAFSVVGGTNITWNNIYAENSNGASLYIAAESEFATHPVSNIMVNRGTLVNANTNHAIVDHGAIMIYNSVPNTVNTGITVKNVAINNTRSSWAQIQIRNTNGGSSERIALDNLAFSGGPTLTPYGVPSGGYNRTGWTFNGSPVPNITAWH